jgi:methylmalonyl-CoA mutase cobalamin-binding subunit
MSLTGKIGIVRPYGDTTGDGRVQLSFTLPVPFGDESERARAEGAALQLAAKMGTDAHTVGIDAILNVKGHAGEKGLEYYREIRVVNMGSQVAVADLVARAAAEHADAVLVSQVVTQRDAHLTNTREMAAAFHAAFVPETPESLKRPLLVAGGPRFDPSAAHDLGVDKIFGRGTTPSEVASYLVHALAPPGGSGGWSPPGKEKEPHEQ